MNMYSFILAFFYVILEALLFYNFDRIEAKSKITYTLHRIPLVLISFISLYCVLQFNLTKNNYLSLILKVFVFIVSAIIISCAFSEESFFSRIKYTAVFTITAIIFEFISGKLFFSMEKTQLLLSIKSSNIILPSGVNCRSVILSQLLLFIVIVILKEIIKIHKEHIAFSKEILVMLIVPASSFLLAISNSVFYLNLNMPNTYTIIETFLLCINILGYTIFVYLEHLEKIKTKYEILHEQEIFQKNKYNQLANAYKNVRGFMHDTKKHIFYIQECARSNATQEIIEYTESMITDLESRYCPNNTGNLVIDSFVDNLRLQCTNKGITFFSKIRVDPQNIPLNDYELTIVLGNLFENAYSASSTVICPHINLTISNTAEDVFTVNIENNFENVNKSSEKITAFDFIHGHGLANVKRIVSEHNGVFNTSSSNDIYSVTIILPLNLT